MVKRKFSSCSQYQSEESSVRLRKRSSLSRSTSSACLRCTNCPICAPITWIACIRCSSGSRISLLLKARTPIVFPPEFTGNTNAPCIPASMAIACCHTRASRVTSATHKGSPDCQTFPASPTPGMYATLRERSIYRSNCGPGLLQASAKRRAPASSSTRKNRPHSQSCASQTVRITALSAAATLSASVTERATVCSSQSSCSARLRLVMRRARPRYPVKIPALSNVGTPVVEKKCSAPFASTSRTWKSLKGWRASSNLRCSSHVPLRGCSPSSQRVFPIIEETASAESPGPKAQVKRWLASCSQYQSPDNSAMARKRASLSPGPSLACFGAGRSLPFCLGRADCLMRAAIVDRPLQRVLTHHPVPPCALGAVKGFVRGAYHQRRPDERIVALGCADAHGHRQRLFRSPCCAKA